MPFPEVERCLGLSPADSSFRIEEGYAVIGYDFDVQRANQQCLFDMVAAKYQGVNKRFRMTDAATKIASGNVAKEGMSLLKSMKKGLPKIKIYGDDGTASELIR